MDTFRGFRKIAFTLGLYLTVASSWVQANGDPQIDQDQLNAKVQRILELDATIETALNKAGLTRPDSATISPALADPLVQGTLEEVLENQLNANPGLSLAQLKEKAAERSAGFLRLVNKDKAATLTAVDRDFADYLAAKVFVTFHLERSDRPALASNPAGITQATRPRTRSTLVAARATENSLVQDPDNKNPALPPRPSTNADDMSPNPNAGRPSKPNANTGSNPADGQGPQSSTENLIDDTMKPKLLANLQKADKTIVQLLQNNGDEVTQEVRHARLLTYVKKSPEDDAGTFLELLNGMVKTRTVTSFDALSDADKQQIFGLIDKVTSGTPAKPTSTPKTKPDPGTQIVDDLIGVTGTLVPGFAPFEGLADDAAGYLVPRLERWRPFQHCFGQGTMGTGRGIFGGRPTRGVYYIEQ